jgi:hypothetical protein
MQLIPNSVHSVPFHCVPELSSFTAQELRMRRTCCDSSRVQSYEKMGTIHKSDPSASQKRWARASV